MTEISPPATRNAGIVAGEIIDIAMSKWKRNDRMIERVFILALYVYGVHDLAHILFVLWHTSYITTDAP